ncbi:hypothetical protein CFP56_033510 [Quercus suber]|uniref:Uncharacterized protein n=1 Tax=Quercus suber TaxID=58331 RepID=A0AAW0JFS4_QUESU
MKLFISLVNVVPSLMMLLKYGKRSTLNSQQWI